MCGGSGEFVEQTCVLRLREGEEGGCDGGRWRRHRGKIRPPAAALMVPDGELHQCEDDLAG